MKESWRRKLSEMTGWSDRKPATEPRPPRRRAGPVGQKLETTLGRHLAGRFRRFHIRMTYKDKLFIAHVRRNGAISFARESADWSRLRGKLYLSPSAAAADAVGRAMNGCHNWKFRTKDGEWVRLAELRAGRAQPGR
jgi:hypothetical protein